MGTHLILHKVRGQPEFDVAEVAQIGEGEGWIISTSGHRAYPYRTWLIEKLVDITVFNEYGHYNCPALYEIPEDWPDHYPAKTTPKTEPIELFSFLDKLGLGVKIVRRI